MQASVALQWRFGSPRRMSWLERSAATVQPSFGDVPAVRNRTICTDESERSRRRRRATFLALILRRAYSLDGWLPPEVLIHLQRVDVQAETGRVLITLTNGARILDTGDRITLRGEVEDITVAEMAECVLRRGWQSVTLTGDEEFRRAMSRVLIAKGVEVVDCPLSVEEQEAIRAEAGGIGFDWFVQDAGSASKSVPRPR